MVKSNPTKINYHMHLIEILINDPPTELHVNIEFYSNAICHWPPVLTDYICVTTDFNIEFFFFFVS